MRKCYICKTRLNESNSSMEHIIPNSLGGNLKSRNLICKSCNSELGSEEDGILAGQLNFIASMLDIKRDRGQPQPIEVENKDKDEKYRLLPGGKPEMIRPKIKVSDKVNEEGGRNISVIARDKKQAKSVLKGLQRKYNIDSQYTEKILKSFEVQEKIFKEHLTFNISFGGKKAFKAVAKIILNFYIDSDQDIKWVKDFIDKHLRKSYDILSRITWIYLEDDVVEKQKNEILHSILIIGDCKEGILYGYVELFNAYRVLVLLNNSYEGPDLSLSYFFDVENREEINRKYNLKLSQTEIIKCLERNNEQYRSNMSRLTTEINNIMGLIYSRHNSKLIDRILNDALEEMVDIYPQDSNPYITEEKISERYIMYFWEESHP